MRLPMLVAVAIIAVPIVRAQAPAFEVVSIKANQSDSGNSNLPYLRNGKLTATNVSLLMLLEAAYDLSASRISGPSWLDSDRYDLEARSPAGVPDSDMMPMLQAMLKERFRLEIHRERKELPVYELVVAKEGLKIPLFDGTNPPKPTRIYRGALGMGIVTMPELAKRISSPAGRPVVDKTGLEGKYSYVLTYVPLSAESRSASDPAPDFFEAVRQQLGLRLEPKKDAIEIIVIDHADRVPSAN